MNQLAYLFLGKPFPTPKIVFDGDDSINDLKHCNHCGKTMTTDEFSIKKFKKDGTPSFSPNCKVCTNEIARAKEASKKCAALSASTKNQPLSKPEIH